MVGVFVHNKAVASFVFESRVVVEPLAAPGGNDCVFAADVKEQTAAEVG